MFGYVKPVVGEMLVREHEFYKATYCGICRAMKKHTGALSNVTLSYDSVFLALVRMLYIPDGDFKAEQKRCIAHPLKKRPMLKENSAIEYTARAFAVLTYYKLLDDLSDETGLKKAGAYALKPICSSANERAELDSLSAMAKEKLDAISALEKAGCQSVDEPATIFGELLGEIFAHGLPEGERLVPYEVGRHLISAYIMKATKNSITIDCSNLFRMYLRTSSSPLSVSMRGRQPVLPAPLCIIR
jgi:hypothetical protein